MTTVLHITAHMGGGVGVVLTSLIDQFKRENLPYQHQIVSFENINSRCLAWAHKRGVAYRQEVRPDSPGFHEMVRRADLVHLHFWNHPALYQFMQSFSGQKARLLMWSHVNGHHAPCLFNPAVLGFPELFTVATRYSLAAPEITALSAAYRRDHVRHVFTTAGIRSFKDVRPVPHSGFNVGYVGTVDYVKLHPRFIELCAAVNVAGVKFVVCGGNRHLDIQKQAADKGVAHLFEFRGQTDDIPSTLAQFDVFGYPLTPYHYGTGEQVLIEAMAAGIPQVVLDNGPERHVVKDGLTGIVAREMPDYPAAIETLYREPVLRTRLAASSREVAAAHYAIENAVRQWRRLYDELSARPKRPCTFADRRTGGTAKLETPARLFLTALGNCEVGELFAQALNAYPGDPGPTVLERLRQLDPIFTCPTKGSVAHYHHWFRNSGQLNYLHALVNASIEGKPA